VQASPWFWTRHLGRALAQPHGGEGRFDDIGGAQVLPMLCGKIEEGNQPRRVGDQRFDRLGILGLILRGATGLGGLAVRPPLGVHHLVQGAFGARL